MFFNLIITLFHCMHVFCSFFRRPLEDDLLFGWFLLLEFWRYSGLHRLVPDQSYFFYILWFYINVHTKCFVCNNIIFFLKNRSYDRWNMLLHQLGLVRIWCRGRRTLQDGWSGSARTFSRYDFLITLLLFFVHTTRLRVKKYFV